jgi:carbamoyltransferase
MTGTLLSLGHGYSASARARRLHPQGWRIIGTTRSPEKADRLRAEAPAVVHVDGTARPQAVDPGQEPLYHAVLEQLHAATGLGVALNTSFNLKGETLVGSATDALATLARSGLDAVWIGPLRIGRPSARALGD